MPTTRSMSSPSRLASGAVTPPRLPKPSKTKRKASDASESPPQNSKKPRVLVPLTSGNQLTASSGENEILPAVLTFSFETAKQHLIGVDSRFKGVFSKLPCQPFEKLERVDPFQTLTSSILGQQISWLAARSIRHRFIRLYYPSLPENPNSDAATASKDIFPTASQVVETDIATLRSAGLSTRKAEYIKDLASRFADARLTNKKLVDADDEELAKILIEVRGIGRWTVDMFAMFSLRRPDILPVGDLGVQRGLIRWFLSLHSSSDPVMLSPKKLPKPPNDASMEQVSPPPAASIQQSKNDTQKDIPSSSIPGSMEKDVSSLPPVPVTPVKSKGEVATPSQTPDKVGLDAGSIPMFPEPFTPSINKVLNPNTEVGMRVDDHDVDEEATKLPALLPEGLTVTELRSRLNGKKKKMKGALLTPKEMEDLTASWRPYRSLGVYYMWALAEETTT